MLQKTFGETGLWISFRAVRGEEGGRDPGLSINIGGYNDKHCNTTHITARHSDARHSKANCVFLIHVYNMCAWDRATISENVHYTGEKPIRVFIHLLFKWLIWSI